MICLLPLQDNSPVRCPIAWRCKVATPGDLVSIVLSHIPCKTEGQSAGLTGRHQRSFSHPGAEDISSIVYSFKSLKSRRNRSNTSAYSGGSVMTVHTGWPALAIRRSGIHLHNRCARANPFSHISRPAEPGAQMGRKPHWGPAGSLVRRNPGAVLLLAFHHHQRRRSRFPCRSHRPADCSSMKRQHVSRS